MGQRPNARSATILRQNPSTRAAISIRRQSTRTSVTSRCHTWAGCSGCCTWRGACHHTAASGPLSRTTRLFFKDAPDRGPADSDASPQDVPCDGPSPELRFREGLPDLTDQPSHAAVDFVPGRSTEQLLRSDLVFDRFLPVADRVGVNDKTLPRNLRRPTAQPHDMQDLGSLLGQKMSPLLGRLPAALAPHDCELPLQHSGLAEEHIALDHQPHYRGIVGKHPQACGHRRKCKQLRNTARGDPQSPIGIPHYTTSDKKSGRIRRDTHNHFTHKCLEPATPRVARTNRTPRTGRTISWPTTARGFSSLLRPVS